MTSVAGQKRKRDEKEHEDAASVPTTITTAAAAVEAKARVPLHIGGPVPYDIPELEAVKGISLEYAETDASITRLAKTVIRQYAWRVAVNALKRRELADVLQHVGVVVDMVASYDVTVVLFMGKAKELVVYDPVRNSEWSVDETELEDDVSFESHNKRSLFAHPRISTICGVSRLLVPPARVVGEYQPVLGSFIADDSVRNRYGLPDDETKLIDFSEQIVKKHEDVYSEEVMCLRDTEGKMRRVSVDVRKVGGMITPQFMVLENDAEGDPEEKAVPVDVRRPDGSVFSRVFDREHDVKIGCRAVHGRLIVCAALSDEPALYCATFDVEFTSGLSLRCRMTAEFEYSYRGSCVFNVPLTVDETNYDRTRTQEGMFSNANFSPFLGGLVCWCHSGVFYCDGRRAPHCVVRATRDGTVRAAVSADGEAHAVYNRTDVDRFETLVSNGYSNVFYVQTATVTFAFACCRDGFVVGSRVIRESATEPDLALRAL